MGANGLKGLVADDMLNAAGIRGSSLLIHSQTDQKIPNYRVPLVYFGGDLQTALGQGKIAVAVRSDISALLQQSHGPADAGFGIPHVFSYIDGADKSVFLGQDIDRFQIHFAGFL